MLVGFDPVIIEINFSVCDLPPSVYILCYGIGAEIHLAVYNMPPSVLVVCYGRVENNFSAYDMPPSGFPVYGSLNDAVDIKLYLTAFAVPPSVLVLCKSVISEINLTIPDDPPAVLILCDCICLYYLPVFGIIPSVCFRDNVLCNCCLGVYL